MNKLNTNNFTQKWKATTYQKYALPQFIIAVNAVDKWPFKNDEKVLDIGCGNGAITYYIAKEYLPNGSITGIDLSKDMIDYAKHNFKINNLDFEIVDAAKLPYENKFDLITSFYCLHWVKDQQAAFTGIANALKKSGSALLYIMASGNKNFISEIAQEIISSDKWKNSFNDYKIPLNLNNIDYYRDIIDKTKLSIKFLQFVNQHINFQTKDAFKTWISAIPFANHLSIDLQKDLLNDISEKCITYFGQKEDGSVNFELPTVIAILEKK